jgi:predicted methyltransferase
MLVSGIPMHRIKDTNPWRDTRSKIKALGRVGGCLLDTTTGLGYTAILAAEKATHITTVELDPAAQKIARQNPWSQGLFDNPKIEQLIGDSNDLIETFPAERFNAIIHDPPMFSLAGELYSLEFYRQAHRVLKSNGRMFHYIGSPESKSGARVTSGVVRRLKQAGFSAVLPRPQAFGVLSLK